jgi:hypothetical protein
MTMDIITERIEKLWLSEDDFIIEETDTEMSDIKEYSYCVLSVDIGIEHFGLSVTFLNNDFSIYEIGMIDMINIQKFPHNNVTKKNCKLQHTKSFCDWINHVFQENDLIFEKADFILIERQPPCGLVGIEQLIFSKWRDKSILISPNSMHKFFNIGMYDYEQRKIKTEEIARDVIIKYSKLIYEFTSYERKHDIADSICLMLYWIYNKQQEYIIIKRKMELNNVCYRNSNLTLDEYFEQFRYNPIINYDK